MNSRVIGFKLTAHPEDARKMREISCRSLNSGAMADKAQPPKHNRILLEFALLAESDCPCLRAEIRVVTITRSAEEVKT